MREIAEGKPVKIGELQRYATDVLMETGEQPFARAAPTGKRIAVVGGGPAGLSCAHRLAMHGHDVVIFDARDEDRRAQRIRHRRLQDASTTSPQARSRVHPLDRRHHGRDRQGARPRLHARRAPPDFRRGLHRPRPRRRQRAWRCRTSRSTGARHAVALHRRAPPGGRPRRAAGRPPRGGDRRRHDGDRQGDARPSASAPRTSPWSTAAAPTRWAPASTSASSPRPTASRSSSTPSRSG